MNTDEIRARIASVNWFHTIDFGGGIVSPGDDDSAAKLKRLQIPQDLSGKTFLDVGAWDGFFSFEAERRGAARVLAVDSYVWDGKVAGKSNAGFLTAREILKSKVEDMRLDALDLSPERVGRWDIVLLAGVLYHIKHPWLLLERAAAVTKELLIVETLIDMRLTSRPATAFYQGGILAKDHADNWCGPNIPALKAMLADCGFSKIKVVHKTPMIRNIFSVGHRLMNGSFSPWGAIQQGRAVIHALRRD